MTKELRTKAIKVRFTESELAQAKLIASGSPLASFIRDIALTGKPYKQRKQPLKLDPELTRQLAGIGNNLNQIARQVNQQAKVNKPIDTVQIIYALKRIEDQLQMIRELHNAS